MAAKHSLPGTLIAVEGLDGSGKSTQVRLLQRWLEGCERRVCFSEWNSSELVRDATQKAKTRQLLTPTTFSLIHATDFADRYEREILPMLKGGYIVLCDRYAYTAFARDGVRGCNHDWLRRLYSYAVEPDLVIYFRLPLETALKRILAGRPKLKWFEAGMDLDLSPDPYESFRIFQGMQKEAYDAMAYEFEFTIVDATRPVHDQHMDLRQIVTSRVRLENYRSKVERLPT